MTELTLVPIEKKTLPIAIVAIVDRSGSMWSLTNDAIGGFNSFIEEQKKQEGDATITTILFDNEYNVLQESADIQNATLLNNENYVPRGNTALLDAIGRAVNTLKERRVNGEIEGAIVSILTDGFENASKEYTHEQIKQLIDSCEEEFGWQFVYLAANQDAFAEGSKFGIKMGNAMNFVASAAGVADATRGVTEYTSNYRAEFSNKKVDNK